MPMEDDEARDFARSVQQFLEWVHDRPSSRQGNPVVERVQQHLSDAAREHSVVSRELPPFEHVNVQVALSVWIAESGRTVDVVGFSLPPHYDEVGLRQLVQGVHLPPMRLSAPELVDLPSGPDRTTACWRSALLLVEDGQGHAARRYVLAVRTGEQHGPPTLTLEVAGLPTAEAQALLDTLEVLRSRHNVYRGQLLELFNGRMGLTVRFPTLPTTARGDVVLPEPVLHRIERHTLHIAEQREALREAGQHLKRGLLLYGPPGTGKTHTTRYVVQQLQGSTVLLLSGQSLGLIGMVTDLARELQPSVVVMEDVDLVAEDRGHGPGANPVLFELLDAMDGAAADADLLFLLTTNRADLLEPALAARPGRVDVAVEIGLPDEQARRRLLELYGRGVPLELDDADVDAAIDRTDGVTASFVKELLRRAVLESLHRNGGRLTTVSGQDLALALDDLLDSTQGVTRALLGVPADQSTPPLAVPMAMPGLQRGGHGGVGWTAYSSEMVISYDDE